MNWEEYVSDYSVGENPDYGSISFLFPEIERKQPSFFTRLNSHLLSEFVLMEQKKTIIYYPDSEDFVLSVVFFKIIAGILSGDTTSGGSNASALKKGDKFRIGDAIVLCRDRYFSNGADYIQFGPSKGGKSSGLPVDRFPNVEKAPADATVSSYKKIEEEYKRLFKGGFFQKQALTLSDRIKKGRTAQNGAVLLVSRDDKFSKAIEDFTIEGEKVSDLISIHKAKYDGDLIPVGKSAFAPQIIIAPTLAAAYIAATDENKISEIYVDAKSIRSLSENEGDILGLIDEVDAPLYFFVPQSSSTDLALLLNRGFKEFRWIPSMINEDILNNSDTTSHPFLKAIKNLRVLPYNVDNKSLSAAYKDLKEIEENIGPEPLQVTDSVALLFKYVFLLARQVSPLGDQEKSALIERGDKTIDAMMAPSSFRFLPNQERAKKIKDIWDFIRGQINDPHPLKEVAIGCDLLVKEEFLNSSVLLIVPNDFSKDVVNKSINDALGDSTGKPTLTVDRYDEFLDETRMFDFVLVCGWLGKERMKRIIFSNIAQNYVPVLYNFELPWLEQSLRKWSNDARESHISKLVPEIDEPKEEDLNLDLSWYEDHAEAVTHDDFDELLQKAQRLQWHGYSRILPGDAAAYGCLISFSDGSFGAFSRGFSVTRIPLKDDQGLSSASANDLRVGDIVVFGGSDHDLLVSESNKLLLSEEHGDSLAIASSWRDAIRKAQNSGMSDEEIIAAMQKAGIVRSDVIFRQWLDGESSVICPRCKDDIVRISVALDDDILLEMADEIIANSTIVYSARIRTGKALMKKLMGNLDVASIIKRLDSSNEFTNHSYSVEVSGIGKVEIMSVVEIGQIDEYPQRIINQRKVF